MDPTLSPNKRPLDCSVRQALDEWFYCSSLGHQAIHYYRYGRKKDCSEKRTNFMFCLKINLKSEEEKQRLLKEREQAKEKAIGEKPNSQDVWTLRRIGSNQV
ncbi:hypothetical protein IWQ61_005046 [Dispira simplex]|nr:hypothetical protein IWQ61_005046 [Dispira simplex]